MYKVMACASLVAALIATPLSVARSEITASDSSCASGLTLSFCGSKAPMFAAAGAAVVGATALVVRANTDSPAAYCPPPPLTTTTTPEPATIALVGTGILVLASKQFTRWRRAPDST
jgi:hypothetical protein